jgi:hypothetical protein
MRRESWHRAAGRGCAPQSPPTPLPAHPKTAAAVPTKAADCGARALTSTDTSRQAPPGRRCRADEDLRRQPDLHTCPFRHLATQRAAAHSDVIGRRTPRGTDVAHVEHAMRKRVEVGTLPRVTPDSGRFFDGGSIDGAEKPDPDKRPDILLRRVMVQRRRHPTAAPDKESFELKRRIGYQARWANATRNLAILVPALPDPQDEDEPFRTDLTSVPDLFTWLVPRTGSHLPAALVHDGLIYDPAEPASYDAAEAVPRIEADRIFRDAMADLGTGVARRWLMWSAVTLATVWAGVSSESPPGRTSGAASVRPAAHARRGTDTYYKIVMFGTLAVILVLGVLATLDFLDVWDLLPWMGDRSWRAELAGGLAMAVLVPAVLSLLWGRLRRAGLIVGLALAVLLHITLALAALTLVFQGLELVSRTMRTRAARAP